MQELKGKVALVSGAGESVGRAIALALSARGAHVVVTGPVERTVAETVGEIVYGGGKARHLPGDIRDPAFAASAVSRAVEVFGGLDLVVVNACDSTRGRTEASDSSPCDSNRGLEGGLAVLDRNLLAAHVAFHTAVATMRSPGHLFVVGDARSDAASSAAEVGVAALVRAKAIELAPKSITCNALVVGAVEPEEVAGVLLFFCSAQGARVSGQSIAIGAR